MPSNQDLTNTLLKQYETYKKLQQELVNLADAMKFANPIVWMMYKHQAYANTDHAINTLGDLRRHCAGEDGTCTRRFAFLLRELKQRNTDLADATQYPDDLLLPEVYDAPYMHMIVNDQDFMNAWQTYEYHEINGKAAKWQNFTA